MANVSDQIEKFIIATIGDNDSIDISRNSLAEYFSCVPSQINYVISTRFTVDRGFVVESKRGGGGFIKITKILDKLVRDEIMSEKERILIESALSDDSLAMPFTIRDKVRAKAFKNVIVKLMNS